MLLTEVYVELELQGVLRTGALGRVWSANNGKLQPSSGAEQILLVH